MNQILDYLAYFQQKLRVGLGIPPSYMQPPSKEDEVDPATTVPEEGGICLPEEAKHLHAIYRRTLGRPRVWIDSAYKIERPIPAPLAGLQERGFVKVSTGWSAAPGLRDLGYVVSLTEQGVIAAKLLGFTMPKKDG